LPMRSLSGCYLLVVVACLAAPGCRPVPLPRPPSGDQLARILDVWKAPSVPGDRMRDDGEGPYPAPWPTLAVLCQNHEQENGSGSSNATLFLAAGPDLRPTDGIGQLLPYADLAAPCLVGPDGSWAGIWAATRRKGETSFIFVDWTGGTVGLRVRIFDTHTEYNQVLDGNYQVHSFSLAFDEGSRLPVYVGDVDGDGVVELLIASGVSNSSGAEGTPELWRVVKWVGGKYTMKEVVDQDFIASHPALRQLQVDW